MLDAAAGMASSLGACRALYAQSAVVKSSAESPTHSAMRRRTGGGR